MGTGVVAGATTRQAATAVPDAVETSTVASVARVRSAGVVGSAWIAAPDTLVTNLHVARASTQDLFVDFSDGARAECYTAAADDDMDLAVIKCPTGSRAALPLADGVPPAGTAVLTAGYPGGEGPTVTRGEMRPERTDIHGIPTIAYTAVTAPGSSGSPVVDASGAVVGVVTFSGGHGVPASEVADLLEQGVGMPRTKAGAEWRLRGIRTVVIAVVFLVVFLVRRWRRVERVRLAALLRVLAVATLVAFAISQVQFMAAGPTTHF